jgi:hypothetical protein
MATMSGNQNVAVAQASVTSPSIIGASLSIRVGALQCLLDRP